MFVLLSLPQIMEETVMKSTIFVLAMCVLAGAVSAQVGPDLLIPYVDSGLITIDGLGADWADPTVYPQAYMYSSTTDRVLGLLVFPQLFSIVL